jgi:hypothetical protein
MANQPLGFGDKNTADVTLHLTDSAGVEYTGNPLVLHSQVLKKAEFFETKLSQRWSSDMQPFEIKVTCSYHPENYIKCIQLMYSYDTDERFNFSNVDEVLAVLPVASEVMFRDCMESCMRYLDAVRWTPEQEAKLRVLFSSLQINILPDLAARLGMSQSKSDCDHINTAKQSLQEFLSQASNRLDYRSSVEQHMFDYFKSNTSPAVKDACRYVLLNQFNANLKVIKSKSDEKTLASACSTLSWLVGVIQRCDAKLLETVVKEFCEDADLRKVIAARAPQNMSCACDILTILIDQVLKAMGNGEIITPMSFRVDFLINWADIMVKLMKSMKGYIDYEKTGIIGVAETLPLVEQTRIFTCWEDILTKNSMSTSSLFKWWAEKVHNAIILPKII